jgi:Na+/H+ antiporter NhaC
VSPVKYEVEFYIPEDGILHCHRRENLKSYILPILFVVSLSFMSCFGGTAYGSLSIPMHDVIQFYCFW